MSNVSRRSVLAYVLPAALLAVVLPGRASAEPQPHMAAALGALRTARAELAAATPDKGGFRVKALKRVDEAIALVEKGGKYDNRH